MTVVHVAAAMMVMRTPVSAVGVLVDCCGCCSLRLAAAISVPDAMLLLLVVWGRHLRVPISIALALLFAPSALESA